MILYVPNFFSFFSEAVFDQDKNDSFDDMLSQADLGDLEKRDNEVDDSFDDMVSQADESEYLRVDQLSPKSKVNDWLNPKQKPKNVENKENFVTKRKNQNVNRQLAEKENNPGPSGMSTQTHQRQALFCSTMLEFFSREQQR